MLELPRHSHRYSVPSSLKGSKILSRHPKMQNIRLSKIAEIDNARQVRFSTTNYLPHDSTEIMEKTFYEDHRLESHAKVFKSEKKFNRQISNSPSMNIEQIREEPKTVKRPQMSFRSANLEHKMNQYLNRVVIRGQTQEVKPK